MNPPAPRRVTPHWAALAARRSRFRGALGWLCRLQIFRAPAH
jgi:hypothetical protein